MIKKTHGEHLEDGDWRVAHMFHSMTFASQIFCPESIRRLKVHQPVVFNVDAPWFARWCASETI